MKRLRKHICKLMVFCFLLTACTFGAGFDAEAKTGKWKQDKTGWYYSYSDGTYAKNQWLKYEGLWYHFNSRGYMQTGWQKISNKWYYFQKNGIMVTGEYYDGYWISNNGICSYPYRASWRKDSKGWWYGDTHGWYAKKQWLWIDGKYYYFKSSGYLAVNEWIGSMCVGPSGAWNPNASTDWVGLYLNEIDKYVSQLDSWQVDVDRSYYSLIYLDNNSTPELVMYVTKSWSPATVVTCYNGKISTTNTRTHELYYIPRSGRLLNEEDIKEYDLIDEVYHLNNGVFKCVGKGEHYHDAANVSPEQKKIWTWNGKDGNQSFYESELKKVYDKSKGSIRTPIKEYSFSAIQSYLNSFLD